MRPSTQKTLAIVGIGLPIIAVGMNFSIVNMAMSTLHKEFNAPIHLLQWLLNAFGICMSVFMVTMGKLSDTHGRRRLYLIGTAIVIFASLISGFAPKLYWIILAQALQGIGGAIILPGSQALLSHLYPEERRSHAIGIWAMLACTSLALGPILGGAILESLGWRWIFFINIPFALFAFFLLIKTVEESKSTHTRTQIDFHGLLLLIVTIASLVFSIMQAPQWGWRSLYPFALFLLSLYLFIRSERKSPSPIIRPDFFLQRAFLCSSLANFCIVFFVWGDFFLMPFFLQNHSGLSPFETGLVMLLVTGPVVAFSSPVGRLYAKSEPKKLLYFGFFLFALSAFIQLFFDQSSIMLPLFAALAFGLGWVLSWGPTITTAVSSVPRDAAALASGAFTTVQEIGGTLGLTIAGTLFRLSPDLVTGYFYGALSLILISLLGLLFSSFLPKRPQT